MASLNKHRAYMRYQPQVLSMKLVKEAIVSSTSSMFSLMLVLCGIILTFACLMLVGVKNHHDQYQDQKQPEARLVAVIGDKHYLISNDYDVVYKLQRLAGSDSLKLQNEFLTIGRKTRCVKTRTRPLPLWTSAEPKSHYGSFFIECVIQ
jgi:hypothetical protein